MSGPARARRGRPLSACGRSHVPESQWPLQPAPCRTSGERHYTRQPAAAPVPRLTGSPAAGPDRGVRGHGADPSVGQRTRTPGSSHGIRPPSLTVTMRRSASSGGGNSVGESPGMPASRPSRTSRSKAAAAGAQTSSAPSPVFRTSPHASPSSSSSRTVANSRPSRGDERRKDVQTFPSRSLRLEDSCARIHHAQGFLPAPLRGAALGHVGGPAPFPIFWREIPPVRDRWVRPSARWSNPAPSRGATEPAAARAAVCSRPAAGGSCTLGTSCLERRRPWAGPNAALPAEWLVLRWRHGRRGHDACAGGGPERRTGRPRGPVNARVGPRLLSPHPPAPRSCRCAASSSRATSSRPRSYKSFERLEQFSGTDGRALMAWLARIAENEIRDRADFHHRRAARYRPLVDSARARGCWRARAMRSALSQVVLEETRRRLEAAIETLDAPHREVIVLAGNEELSFHGDCTPAWAAPRTRAGCCWPARWWPSP